ncbi:MAG: carboxylesterase type [Microbacteriaceae bacterium]|nr:carboxylesterase type [Microbacteriaceae bacterium]
MTIRVATEYGVIEGGEDAGLAFFLNVPYAAPPFGPRRFRPPVAPEPWSDVRDATVTGVGAPQPTFPSDDIDDVYYMPKTQGEDLLTLEVWTPDVAASGLPVMVWIHGGGLMIGSATAPGYSGRTFARDGVVHVGINYRLGVEGFSYLGDGTDNLGFRDQVFALEWVQRNIAAFGGDPANVTIFGQSGGAISVLTLLAMPSAQGLFVRAISSSGTPTAAASVKQATAVTRRLAKRLGVPATRAALAEVPIERTVAETLPMALDFVNPIRHGSQAFTVSPFRAVYGTPSLPVPPFEAARTQRGVPLLTGTVRNETAGFLRALGTPNPLVAWVFRRFLGVDAGIRAAYRDGPRHITDRGALIEAAWTDWVARMPTIRLAEARTAPTWLYEFRWENPRRPAGLGAAHATDNPFVRDDLDAVLAFGERGELMVGPNPPAELAARMHAAWIRFATTGDPGWPAYDTETRQTMVFDTTSGLVPDAAAPERQAWSKRR